VHNKKLVFALAQLPTDIAADGGKNGTFFSSPIVGREILL